jgi:hypothetical protein
MKRTFAGPSGCRLPDLENMPASFDKTVRMKQIGTPIQ